MNEKKQPSVVKTLAWIYGVVGAYTAISLFGPVLLDRVLNQADRKKNR